MLQRPPGRASMLLYIIVIYELKAEFSVIYNVE